MFGNIKKLFKPRSLREPAGLKDKEDIYKWIKEGIVYFKEWYQPVDFGNGVIAHVTTPPTWKPRPDLLHSNHRGLSKWNFIVKKHIPDIKGKRVLDLGCSSGLFSIEMARMGAREVIAIDRSASFNQRSSNVLPYQDVVGQAKFVTKAFELLENTKFPIIHKAHNVGEIGTANLGRFDLIISLNVIYHELDNMPNVISELAKMTDFLVLQTTSGHSGELNECASVERHKKLLSQAGFTSIEVDAPEEYPMPVIIARK